MTALAQSDHAGAGSDGNRPPAAVAGTPRLIAFTATLVLAATTGLPLGSVANLMPQADDRAGPFLGI